MHEVFEHAGLDVDKHVEIDERLFRPHEVPVLLGDPTKAKEKLGWEPNTKFKELARLMYEADYKKILETEYKENKMKLSNQAIGALLMTLQKCLSEQSDITELLAEWDLEVVDNEINVINPPSVKAEVTTENKFEEVE